MNERSRLFPLLVSMTVALLLSVTGCASARTRPSLARFIDARISQPPFNHAVWGIVVEDANGRVLYAHNPEILMTPASNRKMFAMATVVGCDGVAKTLDTEFWIDGTVHDGILDGNLVIRGGGDPSLGGRYVEGNRDAEFRPVLDALASDGVVSIRGGVVADVSAYDRQTIPGSWKYDNIGSDYAVPVDALAYNENAIGVVTNVVDCAALGITTDPGFVPASSTTRCGVGPLNFVVSNDVVDERGEVKPELVGKTFSDLVGADAPGLYAAMALDDVLRRAGIPLGSAPSVVTDPHTWSTRLAVRTSPPYYLLLTTVLKNSQNLYAEMLYKDLSLGGPNPASYPASEAIERDFLINTVGIDGNDFSFDDGSGLAVEDRITPTAAVKLLRWMYEPPRRGLFWSLLATPGEEGTLHHRLAGLENRFRGKTGTLDGVNALSGIIVGRNGGVRYVTAIVNQHTGRSSKAIEILDSIAQRVADF
ncbi:MAG: D-alanyl-D-alanine carboxypeptidase/D-alanyl-D-alanine-endopeptidase [Thermoanaerobaculia bacterium]